MADKSSGSVSLPNITFHAYWYESRPDVLRFELEALDLFKKEYDASVNNSLFRYTVATEGGKLLTTADGKLSVALRIPVKVTPSSPWEVWVMRMIFSHNHPYEQEDCGKFGGTIQIYPYSRHRVTSNGVSEIPINYNHHHLVYEGGNRNSTPFICQLRNAKSPSINAYHALDQTVRWIVNYTIWERTGRDIDGEAIASC